MVEGYGFGAIPRPLASTEGSQDGNRTVFLELLLVGTIGRKIAAIPSIIYRARPASTSSRAFSTCGSPSGGMLRCPATGSLLIRFRFWCDTISLNGVNLRVTLYVVAVPRTLRWSNGHSPIMPQGRLHQGVPLTTCAAQCSVLSLIQLSHV